jgi:hypothetical protein
MNLKKIILQIGTLSFCTTVVVFALLDVSVAGILGLSFIIFVIATGTATYYLVKRYPPPKEGEKKLEPDVVEEEIISDHVISIDRTEVKKIDGIDEEGDKKKNKKSDSDAETEKEKE